MPAVGLGGRMPLQDRAKVGGGWGRVLAESWVMRLVMLPRSFDRLRTNGGWVGFGGWWHFDRLRANGGCVSVVWFAFCRARGALLHGQCHKLTVWPGTGRYRLSQQARMPAVRLGGRRPLQDRVKVGTGWGRISAGSWVGVVGYAPRGPSTGPLCQSSWNLKVIVQTYAEIDTANDSL